MSIYQSLIDTINHRVKLWVDLLAYADTEVEVQDPAYGVKINLRPHQKRDIVSLPTISVKFDRDILLQELVAIALDLVNTLSQSALSEFCDYVFSIDIDGTKHHFTIEFHDYEIRRD